MQVHCVLDDRCPAASLRHVQAPALCPSGRCKPLPSWRVCQSDTATFAVILCTLFNHFASLQYGPEAYLEQNGPLT